MTKKYKKNIAHNYRKCLSIAITLLTFTGIAKSQDLCNNVIFTNDFSSSTGWTTVGSNASISGGTFNLTNAYGGNYNKIYYPLGTTLSDTYFRAECKFTINSANPSGNGVGALVMGVTAGNLDFYSYDASGSFAATAQDAIGVDLESASTTDNNINDWQFVVVSKKGSTLTTSTSYISPGSSIGTYYVRFERTSASTVTLTICSDPAFTVNLPGSPINVSIDPTITGLSTVQQGTNTWGAAARLINASYDDDTICDDNKPAVCSRSVFTNDFSSSTGWTTVGSNAAISGGTFNLTNAYGGNYNKIYYPLGTTLSDTYFRAECKFTINSANPSGNGVGTLVMGVTAGNLDFYAYDASGSFAATAQDAIGVDLESASTTDNNINDWQFVVVSKKGSTLTASTSYISPGSSIGTYYVRFERTSASTVILTICSDPAFTVNLPGSPINVSIDPTITGLSTVQQGTNTWGAAARLINASYDDDTICDDKSSQGVNNITENSSVKVYPNPNNGCFSISFASALNENFVLRLYNDIGQLVYSKKVTKNTKMLTLNIGYSLSPGLYNLILQRNSGIETKKIIVTR